MTGHLGLALFVVFVCASVPLGFCIIYGIVLTMAQLERRAATAGDIACVVTAAIVYAAVNVLVLLQ